MSEIEIRTLRWDDWNRAHLARENHEVSEEEVQEVLAGPYLLLSSKTHPRRPLFLGPTRHGRMLVIVLDPEGDGIYYPVSGRPAHRSERRYYEQHPEQRSAAHE
jgi:uncharacterized DUF497 family protein